MASKDDELVAEVESVKRLLILVLMKLGTSQREIEKALGVSQPSVSLSVQVTRAKKGGRKKASKKKAKARR